jgi:hypothetical protein
MCTHLLLLVVFLLPLLGLLLPVVHRLLNHGHGGGALLVRPKQLHRRHLDLRRRCNARGRLVEAAAQPDPARQAHPPQTPRLLGTDLAAVLLAE